MPMDPEKEPYAALGLESRAGEEEVKRAYKQLALRYHPDKQREGERERCRALFEAATRAHEILADPSAKAALDAYALAQQQRRERDAERHAQRDATRRHFTEELLRREREASQQSAEEAARERFAAELERLRKRWQQQENHQKHNHGRQNAGSKRRRSHASESQKRRSLKVHWPSRTHNVTVSELRRIFSAFGDVEDVVIRQQRSSAHMSALVVMSTESAAHSAASQSALISDSGCSLSAAPAASSEGHSEATGASQRSDEMSHDQRRTEDRAHGEYESEVLAKLRRAQSAAQNQEGAEGRGESATSIR